MAVNGTFTRQQGHERTRGDTHRNPEEFSADGASQARRTNCAVRKMPLTRQRDSQLAPGPRRLKAIAGLESLEAITEDEFWPYPRRKPLLFRRAAKRVLDVADSLDMVIDVNVGMPKDMH